MMTKRTAAVPFVLLVCGLLLTTTALTFASEGYDLSWWTIDGGGGVLGNDGGYSLAGTIGQPDPGWLADGGYSLGGGFWGGGVLTGRIYRVYLPLVLNRFP